MREATSRRPLAVRISAALPRLARCNSCQPRTRLKNLKRATIVGDTTDGGAHPVREMRISDRIVVNVPFMRAYNPISKTNWEGTGVEPDVKCPAADALDTATELAREAISRRLSGRG